MIQEYVCLFFLVAIERSSDWSLVESGASNYFGVRYSAFRVGLIGEFGLSAPGEENTEVTKSQCNRRRQRRLQIFLKSFTFEAWKIHVK